MYIHKSVLMLCTCLFLSCQSGEWTKVSLCNEKQESTLCVTTHQGEHEIETADIWIENDTLVISFPPQLPAFWGYMEIKVYQGRFTARFNGIPFISDQLEFQTLKQQLALDKKQYRLNDILHGYFRIEFKEINKTQKSEFPFYFKGSLHEVVRTKDFNPYVKENSMTFSLEEALKKLGEPIDEQQFNTLMLPEFRVELLNIFPASKDIIIKECTWNSSDTRDISDEGRERLTIWYALKNGNLMPVHCLIWDANSQF